MIYKASGVQLYTRVVPIYIYMYEVYIWVYFYIFAGIMREELGNKVDQSLRLIRGVSEDVWNKKMIKFGIKNKSWANRIGS